MKVLYRYKTAWDLMYDGINESTGKYELDVESFIVKRETEKSYIISDIWAKRHFRIVSKTARKRFAYPTKEEAIENYIHRTKRRVSYLRNELEHLAEFLTVADVVKNELNSNNQQHERK